MLRTEVFSCSSGKNLKGRARQVTTSIALSLPLSNVFSAFWFVTTPNETGRQVAVVAKESQTHLRVQGRCVSPQLPGLFF